jgi:hypothetical protein
VRREFCCSIQRLLIASDISHVISHHPFHRNARHERRHVRGRLRRSARPHRCQTSPSLACLQSSRFCSYLRIPAHELVFRASGLARKSRCVRSPHHPYSVALLFRFPRLPPLLRTDSPPFISQVFCGATEHSHRCQQLPHRMRHMLASTVNELRCSVKSIFAPLGSPFLSPRVIRGACSRVSFAVIGMCGPRARFSKCMRHNMRRIFVHDAALGTGQLSAAGPEKKVQMLHHPCSQRKKRRSRTTSQSSHRRFSTTRDEICKKWERFPKQDNKRHTERRAAAAPARIVI